LAQGDLTIEVYASQLKQTADGLRDVGHAILDRQLVLNLLNGLNLRLANTADIIANTRPLPSFTDAVNMLRLKELRLANDRKVSSNTALAASTTTAAFPTSGSAITTVRSLRLPLIRFGHEARDQCANRLAAVRQLVLAFERQLRRGKTGRRIEEMGVVAEAAGASRRVDDRPVPCALGDDRFRIGFVPQQRQNTCVMRTAVDNSGEGRDQLRIVAGIGFRLSRIARALHARRAGKRTHADTGVVGQRRKLCVPARMPRFRQCILDECVMRLVRFRDAECRLRDDLDPERGKEAMEFAQLPGIVGREDEARNQEHRLATAVERVTHRARPSAR